MAFWGDLDPPAVNRQSSVRRTGKDETGKGVQEVQYPPQQAAQSRASRVSTLSQAPTTSTQSPFVSPTAESFKGDGLAPRPPSFPYVAAEGYKRDYLEKRRRRASRDTDEYYRDCGSAAAPPPAAPDAPRAPPPLSYKEPFASVAPTNSAAPVRSRSARRPDGPVDASQSGTGETYENKYTEPKTSRSGTERGELNTKNEYRRDRRERNSIGGEPDRPKDFPDKGVVRRGTVGARKEAPEYHDPKAPTRSRKDSAAEAEAQRRREWAPDRSPLQRLELTLDSITKEEKRARVEEAELLAREEKAGRGGDRLNQNSVRFRNRPVAKAETPAQAEPQSLPEAGLVRNLSTKQKDELKRSGTIERKKPVAVDPAPTRQLGKGFEYQPQQEPASTNSKLQDSVTPQRGPSFRERAAVPAAGAIAGAVTGAALSRSTSNKLKKEPPGDPWYSRRREAEKAYQEVGPRRASSDARRDPSSMIGGPLGSAPVDKSSKMPTGIDQPNLQKLSPQESPAEWDSEGEYTYPAPVKRNMSKKIQQMTGEAVDKGPLPNILPQQQQLYADRLDRSEELGPDGDQPRTKQQGRTEVKTVNGIKYAVPAVVAAGNYGQEKAARGADGHHRFSKLAHIGRHGRGHYQPGDGLYAPRRQLEEWKNGNVGVLTTALLDLEVNQTEAEKDKAWWEAGHSSKRRPSASRKAKVETYDGENENINVPTQFKPPLYLKCGPLLRYCGLRRKTMPSRPGHHSAPAQETWRGSVMIVTTDSASSYQTVPTLRLFAQPMDLLPPPPEQVDGGAEELAPEYVDPIAGLTKVGRDGRTLYVRPVEHLEEEKDLSKDEGENGLFETRRSLPDIQGLGRDGPTDSKALLAGRSKGSSPDGEKLGKYVQVAGTRLHTEQGVTFWRFNIEVELGQKQQRIAYRINQGPQTGFWVPARGQSMNIMFHSCNGFSLSVNPDQFSGPDPMWRDVLNTHQTQPFHVMLGGGDQVYNDSVMKDTELFSEWLSIKNPLEKHNAPFTPEMQDELETFYLDRYSMWFSQGLFGVANSQIPMVNIFDDHDIIDGFGSYPPSFMDAPAFAGLGAIAFKYYMLFQHQSIINEGEETEPSWLLGANPGPYIKELSRSVFMFLGSSVAFLGLDCRTEREQDVVLTDDTYDRVLDRMYKEIVKGETKHLIVLVGIPVAYPRLVWLENILTSRLMDPIKAMGKTPLFGNLLSQIDGGVEVLDDLNDHWTAKNHKSERKKLIEDLQDLAAEKSVRITMLSGDVHLAAIGQFYSNPKLAIPKDRDFRYMPNIISSAIVNTPPPNAMADILNKRNKIHHLDNQTDENMIPIFTKDVNGTKRNNKNLLPRRNWCSIREYNPGLTPPPTPPDERSPSPPARGGLLRRLSTSRGPSYRVDAGPPISGGLMRNFSLRGRPSTDSERPTIRQRTLSLSRKDFLPENLFRRRSKRRPDDGGINGYGASSDEEDETPDQPNPPRLRGGAGDDSYFPPEAAAAPFTRTRIGRNAVARAPDNGYSSYDSSPDQNRHAHHQPPAPAAIPSPPRRPFHRTPTGLSMKQLRKLGPNHEVNLEGGLDICLNVEVNQKDPTGITVPYRLLVPALSYDDLDESPGNGVAHGHGQQGGAQKESGLKRLMSLGRGKGGLAGWRGKAREESEGEEE